MEMKFFQTAQHFQGSLSSFSPFPKASSRKEFEQLSADVRAQLISEGEGFLNYSLPAIRATDYMHFKRTGNRVDFENLYFARRHALNGLVLAECAEHKGRFMDDIINCIFALCEESGWQLPPHNSYERSKPQAILPDATRPVLDLFACETGAQLACTGYLLEEELNRISPFIVKRIQHELQLRIITPYITQHFWWMGNGDEPMCNWTVWCTQNVLLTAFLMPFSDDARQKIFCKAAAGCDYFLKDYGNDGCCDEGAQYYRHAGLCLYGAMSVLNAISDNAFASLYQWDKIKNIACYILNVHVDDKYYFNFADCSPIAGRAGIREFLFGRATCQPALMQFAARDFIAGGRQLYTDEVDRLNLYYRLQTIFHYEEVSSFDASAPIIRQDVYYKSVGLFLTRSDTLSLAVKAGDNNDSHNHNDTGSFTLYKNGRPVFADIGVESYTQKTFSNQRYEIWTMQSGYHNLPSINGLDEKDGSRYRAAKVKTAFCADSAFISMELGGAYPFAESNQPPCSYVRTVTLDKPNNQVVLSDKTDAQNVILNFITYEKPEAVMQETDLGCISIGTLASVQFSGAGLLAIEALPITDPRLKKAWDHELYRIRLNMTASEFHMTIR